jgi:hypothetical protein
MGNTPPLLLDNGQQPCLSFLLRGGCWSTCRRAASHSHTLSDVERARLLEYITTQLNKLRAATAGGTLQTNP